MFLGHSYVKWGGHLKPGASDGAPAAFAAPPPTASEMNFNQTQNLSDAIENVGNKFFEESGAIPSIDIGEPEYPSAKMGVDPNTGKPGQSKYRGQQEQTPLSSGLSSSQPQDPFLQQRQVKRRGLFTL